MPIATRLLRYVRASAIGASIGVGLAAIWVGVIALVARNSITTGDEAMSIAAIVTVLGFPCNVVLTLLYGSIAGRASLDAMTGWWLWIAILLQWGAGGMLVQWAAWRRRYPR